MHLLHVVSAVSEQPKCDPKCAGARIYLPDGARLRDTAATAIRSTFAKYPEAAAIFGDIEIGGVITPRTAWSPTRLITEPAAFLPLVVRCKTLIELGCEIQDPALALRLVENRAMVLHLSKVLTTHSETPVGSSIVAINEHLENIGIDATVVSSGQTGHYRLVPNATHQMPVSIIIPTAGRALSSETGAELAIERCLASLAATRRTDLDIILIVGDEYSGDPQDLQTKNLPVRIKTRPPGKFDFAAACNLGILAARNELILLLNDDTEADVGAIEALAVHFGDPSIGAVGALLRYPNGTIQHAGMVLAENQPRHLFLGWNPKDTEQFGGTSARDVIAVTGACLMTRRSLLEEVGALSPQFPLSYNDVDLCLKILFSGYRVIVEPQATLLHYETLSREPKIHAWESNRWLDRWGAVTDPWYHPDYLHPKDRESTDPNVDQSELTEEGRNAELQQLHNHYFHSETNIIKSTPKHDKTLELFNSRDLIFDQQRKIKLLKEEIENLEIRNQQLTHDLDELNRNAREAIAGLSEANADLRVELERGPVIRVARAVARRLGIVT